MRSFTTETNLAVDIRVTDTGKVLLVFDGECFALTSSDAARIGENLKEAADTADYHRTTHMYEKVTGPFA